MTARLVALGVDANDPAGLARFWAHALRWEVGAGSDSDVRLVPTDETSFGIAFRLVEEPKVGRNRIHFDLTSKSLEDQQESVSTLVALGARHLDVGQRADDPHVVLADPEGNEFCIIEPQNRFLAGRPRLGALSCDGSRQVGLFWSAALDWPLVWDQGEETAIGAPDGTGPFITWGGGPEIQKVGRNRLYLDLAPGEETNQRAELDRLIALGARRADAGPDVAGAVVLLDPDGNEFCVRSLPDSPGAPSRGRG